MLLYAASPANCSTVKLAPFRPHQPPRFRTSSSLLRYLFPRTRQALRDRLSYLRHSALPAFKHETQLRIWRFIQQRQQTRKQRVQSAVQRRVQARSAEVGRRDGRAGRRSEMTSYPASRSYGDDSNGGQADWLARAEQLPEGSRRKRLAGYLKAANELRVTYQQSAQETWKNRNVSDYYEDGDSIPGEFPDAAVVSKGRDQMILFPSYARKHVKRKPRQPRDAPNQNASIAQSGDSSGPGDADTIREQWDRYEDDHAVVDADVRGWLYTPHKGPMTRKQRIFISLARQLAGLPNPPDPNTSSGASTPGRSSSPHPVHERMEAHNARKEDDLAAKEAQDILQKGQAKADNASRGQYSVESSKDADTDSLIDLGDDGSLSRRSSYASETRQKPSALDASPLKQVTNADASGDMAKSIKPVHRRESWNQPADMSPSELTMAHSNLMASTLR